MDTGSRLPWTETRKRARGPRIRVPMVYEMRNTRLLNHVMESIVLIRLFGMQMDQVVGTESFQLGFGIWVSAFLDECDDPLGFLRPRVRVQEDSRLLYLACGVVDFGEIVRYSIWASGDLS